MCCVHDMPRDALQLPAGVTICEVDDPADCVWLLHEGSVAEMTPDGSEINVKEAPALIGETALLRELGEEHCYRPSALQCGTPSLYQL